MKTIPTSQLACLTDELSLILQYLPIGSVIMYSMTCKANYEWTCDFVKNYTCKYYQGSMENWTLASALRQQKSLVIDDEIEEAMNEIAERSGSICEISNHFIADGWKFNKLYNLLNIRKGDEENPKQIQVETVCIVDPDDNGPPKLHKTDNERRSNGKVIKTIEREPIGYELKGFSIIGMTLTRTKLYKIMTKLKNLQTLSLNIEQEFYRPPMSSRGKGRGMGGGMFRDPNEEDETEDEKGEAFDEDFIYIPLMKNLKKLVIEKGFDNDHFITEILPCFPNLEHFEFICKESIGDEILEALCEHCPRMKHLEIKSDDGSTQFELEITDEGLANFLEKQKQIEFIDLEPAAYISGAIFKRLGDFPSLRSFRVFRAWYNGDGVEQEQDLYFGGNPNPALEFIDIGFMFHFENEEEINKLLSSLKTFAPNLKNWGSLGRLTNEQQVKIAELYLETVETLGIYSSKFLPLLPKCVNLKCVSEVDPIEGVPTTDINPNVTEITNVDNSFAIFSQIFPNVKIIRESSEAVEFLLKNKDAFPNLVHLDCTNTYSTIEKFAELAELRPGLVIENEKWNPPLTSQLFCYQWLEMDSQPKRK